MQDRAPTKPNRYAVYDDEHNFIRYEYHERADEPTQAGDALNKANLLPDTVATALGLSGNAQVKDALGAISGGFVDTRKYWWRKYEAVYAEVVGGAAMVTIYTGMPSYATIIYHDAITFNGSGVPVGVSDISHQLSQSAEGFLIGKYFKISGVMYKGISSTTYTKISEYSYEWKISASQITSAKTAKGAYISDVCDYESNAYLQNGVQGDYYYTYIGKAPNVGARITIGNFVGTGTYGSSNKNSLTLNFPPKRILLINSTGIVFGELIINGTTVYGYSYSGSFVALVGSISGNTISWYAADAAKQLNASGVNYLFVAEG